MSMLAKENEEYQHESRYQRELFKTLEGLFKKLEGKGKKIVIEGTEPLIYNVPDVITTLKNKYQNLLGDHVIIINKDPRFGACDIDLESYLSPYSDVDVVIHLGHNPFPNTFQSIRKLPFKLYFIPIIEDLELEEEHLYLAEEKIERYMDHTINIVYSIQYKRAADKVAEYLSQRGFNISMPKISGMLRGQILGCIVPQIHRRSEKSIFLVVSSGIFHALGVGLYTGKKVFKFDPFNKRVDDIDPLVKKYRALIAWNLFRAEEYKKYAVVVVKDSHQPMIGGIRYITKLLNVHGKDYTIYSVYRVSEDFINNLPKDQLPVIAGCPRIAIDDITRFNRPVLNVEQLQILFGIRSFDDVYPSNDLDRR